jgi:predicted GIY-YIG superfamily endonuclease
MTGVSLEGFQHDFAAHATGMRDRRKHWHASQAGLSMHTKTIGVYEIVCSRNGKSYVGSSTDVYHRICCHISKLRSRKHICKELLKEFALYGEGAFSFRLLSSHSTYNEAKAAEGVAISAYVRERKSYNRYAPGRYLPQKTLAEYKGRKTQNFDGDAGAPLRAWMEANGKHVADLQEAIGRCRMTVFRIIAGKIPCRDDMRKIAEWTGWHVTADDFYGIVPPQPRSIAA